MVLIASWDDFSRAAERLYLNNPDKCRFVVKYRHTNGKLYVKITDDSTVYQYETEVTYDLRSTTEKSTPLYGSYEYIIISIIITNIL